MFEKRYKSHHDSRNMLKKYIPKKEVGMEYYMKKLDKESDGRSKVLYVHIPYCDKICSFCNLNRKRLDNDLEDYTNYLVKELVEKSKKEYIKTSTFEAIYFGGGTPTILKESQLERILKSIKENYSFHEDYEWTFESTIHNLSDKKIELFNNYGVNRLSIGIQTFSDRGREYLNRTFDKDKVVEKIEKLKTDFKGFVCADIIYNYKNQSIEEVKEDACFIKELEMDSVSFYSLMIHEGSELSKEERFEQSQEKDIASYDKFYEEMEKSPDWELLELTKFIRKGRDKYKYITLRNKGAETLAIGVGAGGFIGNISTFNMAPGMSKFFEENEIYNKYRLLGGLLQFKIYNFEEIRQILNKKNYEKFMDCIKYFESEKLGKELEIGFELSKKGIYWGNNLSCYISQKLMEGEFENV
jgi:oxygen-independent coproporphyrinogen-3 oxidase